MEEDNPKITKGLWLKILSDAILDKKLHAYYQFEEEITTRFKFGSGYDVTTPVKDGIVNPDASEFKISKPALKILSNREDANEKLIQKIMITKEDFESWLKLDNRPFPEFWYPNDKKQGRRATQIEHLVTVAKALFPEHVMCIPEGGRTKIYDECTGKYPQIFTKTGFDRAWLDAVASKQVRMENHDISGGKN